MRAARIDEFLRDPIGCYVAGRSYVVWVDSPTLAGSAYFGRLDEREIPEILRLTTLPDTWASPSGFDIVIDCSELVMMDTPSFTVLVKHIQDVAAFATKLRRVAIVRPVGLTGAVIAGLFHDTVQPRYRAALFGHHGEAFTWLARNDSLAAHARVDDLYSKLREAPHPLRELRAYLAGAPAAASAAVAARAVGMSERSLSRRLSELDTSFRDEVQRARLRVAEALLVDTDLKLDAVASKVGFKSRAHFSDFFHRATGEAPSDFRARRR